MGEGKNRISVIVDNEAKLNLVRFQADTRKLTRDEAVEDILHNVPKWQEKIEALEAQVNELKTILGDKEEPLEDRTAMPWKEWPKEPGSRKD